MGLVGSHGSSASNTLLEHLLLVHLEDPAAYAARQQAQGGPTPSSSLEAWARWE